MVWWSRGSSSTAEPAILISEKKHKFKNLLYLRQYLIREKKHKYNLYCTQFREKSNKESRDLFTYNKRKFSALEEDRL